MKETYIHKNVWVPSESAFKFVEQVDPKTGEKKFILKGLMLPFNKVSRNAVMYNTDSIKEKCKQLVGKPMMYNHKVDTDALPIGHFIDSWCENDGWYYKADVDPAERDMIRKLERGDLRHVSIQLIGGKVQERFDESNKSFTEAWVEDVIEGSVVPAPGFLDTTAAFAEALHSEGVVRGVPDGTGPHGRKMGPGKDRDECPLKEREPLAQDAINLARKMFGKKLDQLTPAEDKKLDNELYKLYGYRREDITTTTGKGAMAPTKMIDKEDAIIPDTDTPTEKDLEEKQVLVGDDPQEEETNLILENEGIMLKGGDTPDDHFDADQLSMGIEVELEHTDDRDLAKQIAKAHLLEIPDYYTRLKKMEDEAMTQKAESILSGMDMKEAVDIMKEFVLTLGDIVRLPFGMPGKDAQYYQGQLGRVVKVGDNDYTLEFRDGKKIKVDKEVFNISVID